LLGLLGSVAVVLVNVPVMRVVSHGATRRARARNVLSFPRIADPVVRKSDGSDVVMEKVVFSVVRPSFSVAASTSFCSSRTAYSRVVRVSSTSSTMRMFLPIRLAISRADRSSHCVRVTFVPGTSSGVSVPSVSYKERPMAWMGMHVAAATDGDDEVGLAVVQNALSRVLAELVYLPTCQSSVDTLRHVPAPRAGVHTSLYNASGDPQTQGLPSLRPVPSEPLTAR
ncbi:hypothetical protein KCU62_g189, partial [Aureobasidium sp. EXF-3399]